MDATFDFSNCSLTNLLILGKEIIAELKKNELTSDKIHYYSKFLNRLLEISYQTKTSDLLSLSQFFSKNQKDQIKLLIISLLMGKNLEMTDDELFKIGLTVLLLKKKRKSLLAIKNDFPDLIKSVINNINLARSQNGNCRNSHAEIIYCAQGFLNLLKKFLPAEAILEVRNILQKDGSQNPIKHDVCESLINIIGFFPLGTVVRLNTDEIAVVVGTSYNPINPLAKNCSMRPTVMILNSQYPKRVDLIIDLTLKEYEIIQITGIVAAKKVAKVKKKVEV